MPSPAADLARRLARNAEAACRNYLSNGRRQGRYWTVGDVTNTPGRSLYVKLSGPDHGPGAAGKWTDGATGQHGDLLDLIALNRRIEDFRDVLDEARRFLALPRCEPPLDPAGTRSRPRPPAESSEAARRLFRAGRSVPGTLAEAYLRARGITAPVDEPALRFHPAVWYRAHEGAPRQSFPALLAAVASPRGEMTGIQRTWLDPNRPAKAPVADPRRSVGSLLGNGVWFGLDPAAPPDVLAAGEGLETMLALKSILPRLPMVAALSTGNLAALAFPPGLSRLYVPRDNDAAGRQALERLRLRGEAAGIEVLDLTPALGDWNHDLRVFGAVGLIARLADRLAPGEIARFAPPSHSQRQAKPRRSSTREEENQGIVMRTIEGWEKKPRLAAQRRTIMARVYNKRTGDAPDGALYIGRPSKWGNPFVIGRDGTRAEVIANYETWLTANPKLLVQIGELRGKNVVCHCAPQTCHGDVLLKVASLPPKELERLVARAREMTPAREAPGAQNRTPADSERRHVIEIAKAALGKDARIVRANSGSNARDRSYAGRVLGMTREHIVQENGGRAVVHERRALDLDTEKLSGAEINIRYPHGRAGLVEEFGEGWKPVGLERKTGIEKIVGATNQAERHRDNERAKPGLEDRGHDRER